MRTRHGDAADTTSGVIEGEFLTTTGGLALSNLQAQIEGQERRARSGLLTISDQAELIELVTLRGHVLGCIADYEWAEGRVGMGLAKPDAVAERTPLLRGLELVVSCAAFRRGPYVRGDAQAHEASLAHAGPKCRSAAIGIRAEPPDALR
jgi:hypothetical protein